MVRTYLDASTYGHIASGGIPPGDVTAFRDAVARGDVVALPSIVDVEELLGPWEANRQAAIRRLRLARDLVGGFEGMLKEPADLLADAIRAYAAGVAAPAPTLPRRLRRFLASELDRIVDGNSGLDNEVSEIIAAVRAQKEGFHRSMMAALERTRADLRQRSYSRGERQALTFEVYWTEAAASWAEAFADRVGVGDACRARGLDGLLDVRAVRIGVGAALSLVFSQVCEGYQPERNDGYDLGHTIQASAADVFVTRDFPLADRLARVPVKAFRVVTSLRELLPEPASG